MDSTDGGELLEVVDPDVLGDGVGGGLVSSPVVVIMVTGAKAGRVVNPSVGDGVLLSVLTDDGGGLLSSTISNDESLSL